MIHAADRRDLPFRFSPMLIPAMVHYQRHEAVLQQLADVLVRAYQDPLDRFVRGVCRVQALSTEVWINKPLVHPPVVVAKSEYKLSHSYLRGPL
jgi:hypothetical protein